MAIGLEDLDRNSLLRAAVGLQAEATEARASMYRLNKCLAKLRADIQEQACSVWREAYSTHIEGVVCLLCGEEIDMDGHEDERGDWTEEQWRAACPHTESCAARRE